MTISTEDKNASAVPIVPHCSLVQSSDIAGKLRIMMDGTGVLSADVLKKLTITENPALDNLTARERDIARLIAQGLTNKEIAVQLFIAEGTVRNNIVVIMEKMYVTNRTQLGMMYYEKYKNEL